MRDATVFRSAPRAHEAIAHELRVLIRGGHFMPGDRLPSERQLAARFGVSRPTVREALGALESRGLVVTRQGSGTFVAGRDAPEAAPDGLSDESPAELLETRLVLEVATARLAAKRGPLDPDGLAELRVNVEVLERAASPDSFPDELDREFHAGVARLTGNSFLVALLEPMWAAMSQELFTTLAQRSWSADSTARTAVEHRAVYEAVRVGDPELAGFAMERHLRALLAALLEHGEREGPPPRFFA